MAGKITVQFTQKAQADLEGIYAYLAENSRVALQKFDSQLFKSLRNLKLHPRMGHFVPEFTRKKYLQFFLVDYRIIYRFDDGKKRIFILTIRHQKRIPLI